MSNLSIPSAQDPHGNAVPIEEAIPHKLDYYTCPECGEFVNPRKGAKRQYFAHKMGVLDDTTCSLSGQADVDEMVDKLRTSDIEKEEKQRSIRVHLGEEYDGHLDCFGVIPSLDWGQIPPQTTVEDLLAEFEIQTTGIETPPVAQNFHPSESEVGFSLDPTAGEFRVSISGPKELDSIVGEWTADGLADGDLFVGDQSRARRYRSDRQVKLGEWVYLVMDHKPPYLPDLVQNYTIGDYDILAFPARETTEELLEKYGEGLTTDDYGFDADVILPADVHPTIEAPITGAPDDPVLVGVTPAQNLDPVFEVVSIPKLESDVVDLEPTGSGNPRFWVTKVPPDGSRRISVHQRNSSRHRMIHLHADEGRTERSSQTSPDTIGIAAYLEDSEPTILSPLGETSSIKIGPDFEPAALPTILEYTGPDGLNIDIRASLLERSSLGPTLTRTTKSFEEFIPELSHWVRNGCESVKFGFDGIGSVTIGFSQPELATTVTDNQTSES